MVVGEILDENIGGGKHLPRIMAELQRVVIAEQRIPVVAPIELLKRKIDSSSRRHPMNENIALWDKTRSFRDIKNAISHERGSERASEQAKSRSVRDVSFTWLVLPVFLLLMEMRVRCLGYLV